ncbi:MAG: MSEP-CTERM sorting domain-containing protein, partial [Chthoniobacterales bacterium]
MLPQALLLFLNWQAWDLASGDMDASERTTSLVFFAIECALLVGGLALFTVTVLRRCNISRIAGGCLLLGATFHLTAVFTDATNAIPNSVQDWMLPPGQWIYEQFMFMGIGALYGAFRLLCPDREQSPILNISLTLVALAAPFAILFLVISTSMLRFVFDAEVDAAKYIILPLFLSATFLGTGAILRICISLYTVARRSSPVALAIVTFIVALVLPLAGLITNAAIAFPADFQLPLIYTLAIVNGIVLTLPNFSNPLAHRLVWLAQCATFFFTAYFFAVFLPVIPLMPLGAMFFGLGLLICVPSALFLLHGCRILDGMKAEIRDGRRWIPPLLAAGAIALGPTLLTTQILRDRASLHQALDHLQYPDYAHPVFTGDRASLRTALINLRNFKEGRYLPLYSEFYNWLAFDNLLLPDKKLAETWIAFFGDPMPAANSKSFDAPFLARGRGASSTEILNEAPGARPPADAITKSLRTVVTTHAGEVRALAQLVVENPTANPAEYRALVHVPDGVFITNMLLTIDTERVPAKLFEERAALWVYNKITEVRPVTRDPAILRYVGPQTAELRVFPVNTRSTRSVEIEFTYPDNFSPTITVDGRPLDLPAAQANKALRNGIAAWVPPSAVTGIAPLHRTAHPHLILDISKHSQLQDREKLGSAIKNALAAFPDSAMANVTFANFESRDFHNGTPLSVRELRTMDPAVILKSAGKFDGGFLEAFAIKSALTRAQSAIPGQAVKEYPAVVVLRGTDEPLNLGRDQLPQFAALAPDQPFWWALDPGATAPREEPLDPAAARSAQPRDVRVFDTGTGLVATPAGEPAFLTG